MHDRITGRYMSLAFRGATIGQLNKKVLWLAPRPAPAPAGDFRQLADHGFCQLENKVITA
jgi:hypothetical protein